MMRGDLHPSGLGLTLNADMHRSGCTAARGGGEMEEKHEGEVEGDLCCT